ncbi:MAG TPA: tetratricopeptide repeat protein [Burkholderiaceae bacterium]|nr:tetratricopeptide repeat protein [Burkholderiaceae bacterium]
MATHLDLQEQEQLDQLRHFWKQYGNLITWTLILALGAFAAWNGWQQWQRKQGVEASALFDEVDRAAQAGETERVQRAFADLRERYPRTAYAGQAGLLAANTLQAKGQTDQAREALKWVAEQAKQEEYRALARLRLAGLLIDAGSHDEALRLLDGLPPAFAGLVADRRGDALMAKGDKAAAQAEYEKAYKALPESQDLRQIVLAKLTALGAAPAPEAAASAAR